MSEDQSATTQNDFVTWIFSSHRGVEGLIVSLVYISVVFGKNLTHIGHLFPDYSTHEKFHKALPSAFQCLALLPAFWQCATTRAPDELRKSHLIAAKACDQFARYLAALIATWICFYFFVFLGELIPNQALAPWTDLLNNMQAVFVFLCYWTLTAITIPEPGADTRRFSRGDDAISVHVILSFALWLVVVFLLADLAQSVSNHGSSRFWFQLLSGLAVGTCIALLAGCLESEYLDAPWTRIVTACLYCYAVLQLAYIGFNRAAASPLSDLEKHLEQFATITSLPMKLLLVGFCFWALQEGRLAFYMEKTRALIRNVPDEWNEFSNSFNQAG